MAQARSNPNRQGPFGNTLLHSAVASGNQREVQRLLSAGADPHIRNREGQSPLRVAALLGHDDIYHLLERRRAEHLERLLDQALADTFPASDPIAISPIPA